MGTYLFWENVDQYPMTLRGVFAYFYTFKSVILKISLEMTTT